MTKIPYFSSKIQPSVRHRTFIKLGFSKKLQVVSLTGMGRKTKKKSFHMSVKTSSASGNVEQCLSVKQQPAHGCLILLTERVFLAQSWQAWLVLEPIIPGPHLLFVSVFFPFSHPTTSPCSFSSWSGLLDPFALAI